MKGIRQSSTIDQHHNDPTAFSWRISQLLFQHLRLFTGWGFFNTLACLPFLIYSSGSIYYFMLMNFTWGLANAGFAGLFYWHIHAQRFLSATFEDQTTIQRHVCNMLTINIVLDIGYIFIGICLLIFSQGSALRIMFMAFGAAIVLQGLFLLVQDVWFFLKHKGNQP